MKAAILALVIGISGATAPSPKQAVGIDGRYCGRLWSNGDLVEAITMLTLSGDGRLTGTYQFADGDTRSTGTLTLADRRDTAVDNCASSTAEPRLPPSWIAK